MNDEYRITARIRRADGVEKTVTFRGNMFNIKKKLKQFFKAESYQVRKAGVLKFSDAMPWESVDE